MKESKNRYDAEVNNDKLKCRLRDLLQGTGPNGEEGQELKNTLATELGATPEMVRRYASAKEFPSMQKLLKIARFFDCSLDYLIGLSDTKSPKAEIQAICEYTGLSQGSVENLHFLSESEVSEAKRPLHLLNIVLSDLNNKTNTKFHSPSVFSLMDQFITAGNVIRRLDSESAPQDYEIRKFEQKTITIDSSEELTEVIPISELYKEHKMQLIRAELERYREESKNGLDKT